MKKQEIQNFHGTTGLTGGLRSHLAICGRKMVWCVPNSHFCVHFDIHLFRRDK